MKTPSILLSALLLAGCAGVGPQYSRPATAVPDDWQHWHGGSAQLRETGIAAGQAYARFDDPVLRQLLQRAAQANHDVRAAALRFARSRVQRDVAAAAGGPRLDAQAGVALGVPGELLARRPDIAAAEAALRAATARIGIARAGLYPRITLGLSFGAESVAAGRFGEWGSRQWSVGPGLSLPLFDGGVRRATVTLRELDQQEAAVAWQQAVLRAWHEADDALSAYAAERARRESAGQREQAARTALELATVRYRQGLSDALPLLDAQRTLLAARRDRVRSEAALAVRLLAICKATGVMPQA